jgi:hypothetical protein
VVQRSTGSASISTVEGRQSMARVTLEADEALAVGTRNNPLQIRIGDQMAEELALRISHNQQRA